MSARNPRVILTPAARADLRDIQKFTQERWGREQGRVYRERLLAAFAQLSRFPDLGSLQPEFGPEVRGHRVQQHFVIYLPSATELLILRVVHVRRDRDADLVS